MNALSLPQVLSKTSLGKTKVYALMKAGQFPRPVKCGRRSVWAERDVDTWLHALFATGVLPSGSGQK